MAYRDGQSVAIDNGEAVKWFNLGAAAGDGESMSDLGDAYLPGRGVTNDVGEGIKWIRKGAETGDPAASFRLVIRITVALDYPRT